MTQLRKRKNNVKIQNMRNDMADRLADIIDELETVLTKETRTTYQEYVEVGQEIIFYQELIKKIEETEEGKEMLNSFMRTCSGWYGPIVWYEFTPEQRKIIAIRESKLYA